ncbi:MAG: lysylphosphatidylglycerol synthase transmembrane domain-containing protein [Anaerolineales bacterium]
MRKIIFILLIFLSIGFISLSFSELEKVLETLRQSSVLFLLLAVLVQGGWIMNEALIYQKLYRLMDLRESLWRLALLSVAGNFVNIIAPTGGMSSMAVFVDDAARRGHPRGRAAAASALFLFLDYAAFLVVLTLGLIVLVRRNELNAGEITASVLMFGLALALGVIIYVGAQSGKQLGKLLAWGARLVNTITRPIIKRDYLHEARAHEFATEIAEGLSVLHGQPRGLIKPYLLALLGKALQIVILMLTFLDFRVVFSSGTLIAGFATAYLFLIISPTPSGVGVVEGILPLALTSLRVPWEQAVISTLAYRAVTFWLPLALGGPSLRLLQHTSPPAKETTS